MKSAISLLYWLVESLHTYSVELYTERSSVKGRMRARRAEIDEGSLMMLLAGPMAECLAAGVTPRNAWRCSDEYRLPNSDSTRIRNLVKFLRNGKDDRPYQFEVQERTRAILQEQRMWNAIQILTNRLDREDTISGEDCEAVFQQCGAPTWLSEAREKSDGRESASCLAARNKFG